MKFIRGLIVGWLLIAACVVVYFKGGFAPVATADKAIPFESLLAGWAVEARIEKEVTEKIPVTADEANLTAGTKIYVDHCAMCHGLPNRPSAMHSAEYPHPPQMFEGKGVTDDHPGETYWKVANGIRMTGMPAFQRILNTTEMWQVTLMLANADKLPHKARTTLDAAPAPWL